MPRSLLILLALCLLLLPAGSSTAGEREVVELSPEEAGYEPYLRFCPRHPAGRLDWLLVTTSELAPAFAPLVAHRLLISRLGVPEGSPVSATTSFPFQRGFPQRIGANVTSVMVTDLDGRRGLEILFGDDKLGLWALYDDGREVRHAGDNWTFGLFGAIENGVFEPTVADIGGSRRPEILVTGKLGDRKLYAFTRDGKPVEGFPVSFRSRLMTPPLVADFDGRRGNEILVVSGLGKTVELVRPDGHLELFLGAADGVLRVWDLPYRIGRGTPTWKGLQGGASVITSRR